MSKCLYFDLQNGLSGDMLLSALVHTSANPEKALSQIKGLKLKQNYTIEVFEEKRSHMLCKRLKVLDEQGSDSDTAESPLMAEHHHVHAHGHHSHQHDHHHVHYSDIVKILAELELEPGAKKLASEVFRVLAEAESEAHGIEVEKVHFHEVGALDSQVDIIGACVLLDALEINALVFSAIYFGSGSVRIAHGDIPLPVPAVAKLCEGFVCEKSRVLGELITPTAAAFLKVLGKQDFNFKAEQGKTVRVCGSRHYEGSPGYTQVSLCKLSKKNSSQSYSTSEQTVIEINLDDMSGEELAYVQNQVLKLGARDAWLTPIIMKKGRPGQTLSVLCDIKNEESIEQCLWENTSTWGWRKHAVLKQEVGRETVSSHSLSKDIISKKSTNTEKKPKEKFEWASLEKYMRDNHLSLNEVKALLREKN